MKKKPKPRKWLPSHVTVQKVVPSKKRYDRAKEKRNEKVLNPE